MIEITMPQLGESVVEATLESWLVKPGDQVEQYQAICEVITDKVNVEIPAPEAGVIGDLLIEPGVTVAVGTPICILKTATSSVPESLETEGQSQAARYSPAVLKLAQDHNLNLAQLKITGSGAGGRITRKDILAYLENKPEIEITQPVPEAKISEPVKTVSPPPLNEPKAQYLIWRDEEDQVIPVDPIRRTIAEKMVASVTTIPHAWAMVEVDLTELVKLRESIKDEFFQKEGVKLTYLPFFIKAVVTALQKFPIMNSSFAGNEIIIHKHFNVSMAVATEKALFVPVIHDADRYSVPGLTHKIAELAYKARADKLSPAEIDKGTFTVNNTGSFGSQSSKPIINPPQSGMITLESIMKKPVVIDDMIGIRSMANICFSFDHRITDGLTAGRFLHSVCDNLKNLAYQSF